MDFLTLFISLRCTHACAHCLYGCSPGSGEHMPWEIFLQSLATTKKHQIRALNFFGGEPLLNPRIFPMLQTALEQDFGLILATNCRPLEEEGFFHKFVEITQDYKDRIAIFTARDKFHLQFFDPMEVAKRLQETGYKVELQDYSDRYVLLSPYNAGNEELRKLDTRGSCCNTTWTDHLGVLPDGGWTICPPSLEVFGNIYSHSMAELVEFKRGLPLRYREGCTECLKDFQDFQKDFEKKSGIKKETIPAKSGFDRFQGKQTF